MTSSPGERLKLAQEYLAEREKRDPLLTPSRTFCNSTTSGLYTGNSMEISSRRSGPTFAIYRRRVSGAD